METDVFFNSEKPLTSLLKERGIDHWSQLLIFLRKLPYGRNLNREDLSLVITEGKGTCSSKHAFLKEIDIENELNEVQLIVGIYNMSEANTPAIGNTLSVHGLKFIPEAHCYVRINGKTLDVTSETSDFVKIEKAIIEETIIESHQVSEFKVQYHQEYLKQWIALNKEIPYNFSEIWQIREDCIKNLTLS